ncbi:MAG: heat shock factor family protein [Muribaculaceae bacterium]|nr:heat shock factor family protein [Muribaculaceae bacterium]
MTLKEMYAKAKKQEKMTAPATAFVKEVARVAKKSEVAVRRWLAEGDSCCQPDALTQEVLARHFRTSADRLFPKAKAEGGAR